MAYSRTNPPALIAQTVGSDGGSVWRYSSADAVTTVAVSGYIDDAADLGFKVGDSVLVVDTATPQQYWMFATLHTPGTAEGALVSTAGEPVGETSIVLASAGTGTVVVGDIINFAGDDTNYRVTTGDADVSGGGTLVITPGLVKAIPSGVTTPVTIRTDTIVLTRFQDDDTP